MRLGLVVAGIILLPLLAPGALAQSAAALVAEAREAANLAPAQALRLLRQALAADSTMFEAHWRAAVALVDIGLETPDAIKSPRRDSLFLEAERHARRAVALDSNRAEGHFVLGMALGRVALTKSKKDRVRYAKEIFESATRALAIAPQHDGAHHILALWHAEAMRTSGFNRFMAKNLLGGKILSQASWDRAIHHLETAVSIDPARVFHRLDLARVYVDRKRYGAARQHLNAIAEQPNRVAQDGEYRKEAARLLAAIADRVDRPSGDSAPSP
ncbi:MAG: tetratricopeptide repeat protein [Gemmatimonadales bacterium]